MSFSLMSPAFNGGAEVLSSSNEVMKSVSEVSKFDPDDRIDLSKTGETVKKYNPDDRVDCLDSKEEYSNPVDKYDPDDRVREFNEISSNSSRGILENNDTIENNYLSTYKERLDQTPREDGERGEWTGERGESKFIPNDKEILEVLAQHKMEGIEYQDAIPDFSELSKCTVEIDNMTEIRRNKGGNFEQCDEKCAEQWNLKCQDGKNDWTARDVQKWRESNGYSWHERNDMKTCDLIPTIVNDYFGHLGGVGECRRRDLHTNFEGEFDE